VRGVSEESYNGRCSGKTYSGKKGVSLACAKLGIDA